MLFPGDNVHWEEFDCPIFIPEFMKNLPGIQIWE